MANMTFDEYINVENMTYSLNKLLGLEGGRNVLIGKVFEADDYAIKVKPYDLRYHELKNPFTGENIHTIIAASNRIGLKKGNWCIFKFIPNRNINDAEDELLFIDTNTITRYRSYDEFVKKLFELDINPDVIQLYDSVIVDPCKRGEVYITSDIEERIIKRKAEMFTEITELKKNKSELELEIYGLEDSKEMIAKDIENSKEARQLLQEEMEGFQDHIANLQSEKEALEAEIGSMELQLGDFIEKRELEEDSYKDIMKKAENYRNSIQALKLELDVLQKNKDTCLQEIKRYETLGFSIKNKNENFKETAGMGRNDIVSPEEQIDYIQKYLFKTHFKELYYDKDILRMFYVALKTDQLTILCGPPGTGKTSLVEGFSKAIGAKSIIIPVQPNWMDNQDLLGFYNPIDKQYVSTPFLDAILNALDNKDKLYFVCLDEMNLAHVEYYFNEFLSKMQTSGKTISLYSRHIYKAVLEEVKARIGKMDKSLRGKSEDEITEYFENSAEEEFSDFYSLKKQWESIVRFPYEIEIPDNIRFIGTINMDETTKSLSPKVKDRSFIIKLNRANRNEKDEFIKKMADDKKEYTMHISNITASTLKVEKCELPDGFSNLTEYEPLLRFKIVLNERFDEQARQILGGALFNQKKLLEYIICCLILPKLNAEYDPDALEGLKKVMGFSSLTKKLLDDIIKASGETFLSFFGG